MKKFLLIFCLLASRINAQTTYTTNFPTTENPISEGSHWYNTSIDWKNARTTPGLAFGTNSYQMISGFDDSVAILTGTWGPNQVAQATVHSINQHGGNNPTDIYEEVELHLRMTISAHNITGYEINFRCTHDGTQYVQIGRWNGPLNNNNFVGSSGSITGPGIFDGDIVKATIVGNVITAYINDVQVNQATDPTPFTTGNPGIGFWLNNLPAASNSDFGFTSFTASDSPTYYVATTGSNTGNSCLIIASPCLTIGYGLAKLAAASTLWIRAGTYSGGANQINDSFNTIPSGNATNPITIGAYLGSPNPAGTYGPSSSAEVVTIQVPNPQNGVQFTKGEQYLIVQDLIIDGSLGTTDQAQANVYLNGGSSNNIFQRLEVKNSINFGIETSSNNGDAQLNDFNNNYVHNNGMTGGAQTNGHGIYLNSSNNIVENNLVSNNLGYGIQVNSAGANVTGNVIRRNRIVGGGRSTTTTFGITVERDTNAQIYDNLIYNRSVGACGGIQVYSLSVGMLVAHNTIYNVSGDGIAAQFYDPSVQPIIRDNIIYMSGPNSIINYGDSNGSTMTWMQDHNFIGNPTFANAGTDFHLTTSSGARSFGVVVPVVTTDFDNLVFLNPPAAGVYEFMGMPPPPPPPSKGRPCTSLNGLGCSTDPLTR